ncbi:5095_t:CDS:2 [Paraglomus brasilianum]|uniref:5095_t:CDS:1 n=1 Tax=Paraglomus brasilianum TaxID=144538 RepID=A0A9N8VSQ6_9GLOM|nr:5095_t:CDS:2 [Paraglomus brasilianum]
MVTVELKLDELTHRVGGGISEICTFCEVRCSSLNEYSYAEYCEPENVVVV